MTRTVRSPKPPAPVTPDGRLGRIPFRFSHSSATLGWSGLRVEYDPQVRVTELVHPPLECLFLALQIDKVPERVDHACDDARYEGSGLPHSVTLMPPGLESRWRWQSVFESTQFQLSPALVAKVAEEAFDLDPARVHFRARYFDRSSPEVVDTLKTLRNELLTGGQGGRLCAESLANVLVVQLIRQVTNGPAMRRSVRGSGDRLPRHALRAVEEYIDAHLDQNIALADLAAVAHRSEFHFARLFKLTTGLPPHQFVIHQRVERAKRLIGERRLTLAQVATAAGFCDQSHLTRHFKRLVGVTPGRFA